MSKKSKIIYTVSIAAAVVIVAAVIFMLIKNNSQNDGNTGEQTQITTSDKADVDAIAVPKNDEIKKITDGDIFQLDNLTDKYVLRNYQVDEEDNSITYYYQTHLATNGERLMIIAKPMTQEEFAAQVPAENIQTQNYKGIDLTYAYRTLYYLIDGEGVEAALQKMVDENVAEVEYGNTMDEVIDMQKMYWYDNGVSYTMKAYYHNFSFEDMCDLVHYFIDNKK